MTEYSKENFRAECDRRRAENLIVKGKTYDIKDQIKDLGGIWDSKEKQWLMPDQESVDQCKEAMGYTIRPRTEEPQPEPQAEAHEPIDPDKMPF